MKKRTPLEHTLAKLDPTAEADAIAAKASFMEAELAKLHPATEADIRASLERDAAAVADTPPSENGLPDSTSTPKLPGNAKEGTVPAARQSDESVAPTLFDGPIVGGTSLSFEQQLGKNGRGRSKQVVVNLAEKQGTGQAEGEASDKLPAIADQSASIRLVALTDLVLRAPFSTLLPIDVDTYGSIKADMAAKGFDPSQPCHLWEHAGQRIAVDGCTRIKAAGELGITHAPAFIHTFADEGGALEFAIKCQINRRNIRMEN